MNRWILIINVFILTSCAHENYFLNPFHSNSNYYHSLPLRSDSTKSANYLHAGFSIAGADLARDNVFTFNSEYYRTHTFGLFEAYYGADFSLGYYEVMKRQPFISYTSDSTIIKTINARSGKKFFGGYGANAGIAFVLPFGRGEWRILGIESAIRNEFGEYIKFRKGLPDSIATANMNSTFFPTIGISTEFIGRGRKSSIGYKIALGTSLKKENINYKSKYDYIYLGEEYPVYFSQTLSYTRKGKWCVYYQLNFASYTILAQTGFIYQLGNKHNLHIQ